MTSIKLLSSLTQDSGSLLHSQKINDATVQVRQLGRLRWLNFGNNPLQALINLDDPDRLVFPYTEAMMAAFLFVPEPQKLLNMGFGGGCIERFVRKRYPGLSIVSVDASREIVEIARKWFFVPDDIEVHNESAERYLDNCRYSFDIVFCDIFDASGYPNCITDPVFYERVHEVMTPDGIAVFNNLIQSEEELLEILLPMRLFFPWVFMLEFSGLHNVLLFSMKEAPPPLLKLEQRAEQERIRSGLDLRWLPQRLTLLPKSDAG